MTKDDSCNLKCPSSVTDSDLIKDGINKIEELLSNLDLKKPDVLQDGGDDDLNDIARKLGNVNLNIQAKDNSEILVEENIKEENSRKEEEEKEAETDLLEKEQINSLDVKTAYEEPTTHGLVAEEDDNDDVKSSTAVEKLLSCKDDVQDEDENGEENNEDNVFKKEEDDKSDEGNGDDSADDDSCDATDLANLKYKKSLEELKKDSAQDKEEQVNYLPRGPMTEHRGQSYRFSPLVHPSSDMSPQSHFKETCSPGHEKSSSTIFDVIDFGSDGTPAYDSGPNNFYNQYGNSNLFNDNVQTSDTFQSFNSQGQYNLNSNQQYTNQTSFGYNSPSEALNDDWNQPSPHYFSDNSNLDLSNNSYGYYQPLTPPKDPSPPPVLQDEDDCSNLFSSFENELTLTKSEDLITILKSIKNDARTEPRGSPETELQKLRSVLEDKDSIRHEMGMYLKEDPFQQNVDQRTFNTQNSALNGNTFIGNYEPPLTPPNYVAPLTPPNYVSPLTPPNYVQPLTPPCYAPPLTPPNYASPLTPPNYVSPLTSPMYMPSYQDSICDSPLSITGQDVLSTEDRMNDYCSEEHLTDILKGIDEINPDELNIYLENVTNVCDPSYARNIVQGKCKPNALDHAFRRLSTISTKYLCKKDEDGDTCLMIVYSKPEDSPDFYENVYSLQEKVREVRVCCEMPLGKAKRCKICGNADSTKFYTPLSLKNKQGDTALSCAAKTNHSEVIVNYLLDGILQCEEDFRRVFDVKGKQMLADVCQKYTCLRQYI